MKCPNEIKIFPPLPFKEKTNLVFKKKFYFLKKEKDPNGCPGRLSVSWTRALTKMPFNLKSERVQTHRDLPGHHRWLMLYLQPGDNLSTDFKS